MFRLFDPLRNVNISLSFCLHWLRADERREGNLGYQANENEQDSCLTHVIFAVFAFYDSFARLQHECIESTGYI